MKKNILLSAFLLLANLLSAQTDTTYFNKDWETSDMAHAVFYRIATKDIEGYEVMDYFMNGKKRMMARCTATEPMLKNGVCVFYDIMGEVESYGNYKDNKPIGIWVWRDQDGKDSTVAEYGVDGKKLYTHFSNETSDSQHVFTFVETVPEFPGGPDAMMKFIDTNFKMPDKDLVPKVEGKVYVTFVIDEQGYVIDPRITKSLDPLVDEEALRVTRMLPRWRPGAQGGKNVKVKFSIPFTVKKR